MRIHVCVLLSLLALVPLQSQTLSSLPPLLEALDEPFAANSLDPAVWHPTASGICSVEAVDVSDGRLRVRVGTLGQSDLVVGRGLRTTRPLRLAAPCELSLELDWNEQVNGCYLEAGVYLCPAATDVGPEVCSDWWRVVYIGVPPGQKARIWSSLRLNGGERALYSEGWPDQRSGRNIGLQRISLRWDMDELRIVENDRLLFALPAASIPFREAYLYLQVKSHSNYPPRDLFFDNITFQSQR